MILGVDHNVTVFKQASMDGVEACAGKLQALASEPEDNIWKPADREDNFGEVKVEETLLTHSVTKVPCVSNQ